jgi:hypothetical protein
VNDLKLCHSKIELEERDPWNRRLTGLYESVTNPASRIDLWFNHKYPGSGSRTNGASQAFTLIWSSALSECYNQWRKVTPAHFTSRQTNSGSWSQPWGSRTTEKTIHHPKASFMRGTVLFSSHIASIALDLIPATRRFATILPSGFHLCLCHWLFSMRQGTS